MKANIVAWIIAVIVAALLVWLGISIFQNSNNKPENNRNKQTKAVDAYVVHPQKLQNEISVAGTLLAFDEVELKNEVSGRIVELNLPEGQFVKKGTLLVKLYDGDLQANLNKLNAQLSTQQQVYQRQAELFKVN